MSVAAAFIFGSTFRERQELGQRLLRTVVVLFRHAKMSLEEPP